MKTSILLAGIAALFLATGTAKSSPSAIEQPMCEAGENGTEIPCDQLGVAYDCGQGLHGGEAGEPDEVWVKHTHIASDLSSHTVTIFTPHMTARKSRRYPVFNYDL